MRVPNSQLTTNFLANYQLTTVFLPDISLLLTPLAPSVKAV